MTTLIFRRIDAFSSLTRQIFPRQYRTIRYATEKETKDQSSQALCLRIPTPEDMEDIAALLSVSTTSGDTILLDGDLGAGKTCFSRGFIRARTGFEGRITSPTYLLSNTYLVGEDGDKESDGGLNVHHLDLYRLNRTKEDLMPLDLDNVFTNGIALIEWPSRLIEKPERRLDVTLTIDVNYDTNTMTSDDGEIDDERCRIMRLVPHGGRWVERLQFYESEGYFEDLIVDDE